MTYLRRSHPVLAAAIMAVALCAGCFGGCGGGSSASSTSAVNTIDVTIVNSDDDSFTIAAELAITDQEKALGLMNRESLAQDSGMLFVYPAQQSVSFWMKNTLIPLDMIFIDENGNIVDIHENAQPGDLTPYTSAAPAKRVLEVNGGWCDANNVAVGDTVEIPAGY